MTTKENYREALLVDSASIPLETTPKGTVKSLRRQLANAKAENERLRGLVKRYYKKHHDAVMADAVRVAGGFMDCLCDICADVRRLEATDETPTA